MIRFIKEYFELSRKEFNGIVTLCVLILIAALVPDIYPLFVKEPAYNYSKVRKEIKDFYASEIKETKSKRKARKYFKSSDKPVYFMFNPNGLPESDWLKLGLSLRQIKVIKNFEAKGGRFFKREDLKKIYSVSPEDYARLENYIAIPPVANYKKTYNKSIDEGRRSYSRSEAVLVELNSADSVQLESLKGIGAAFASRILKYRKRLGGFIKKEQLLEVYGMDSAHYHAFRDRITLNPDKIDRLHINTVTFEDLKRFPYLSYKQINAILQYRKQHGSYSSAVDLKKVLILNDAVIEKIAPYLIF